MLLPACRCKHFSPGSSALVSVPEIKEAPARVYEPESCTIGGFDRTCFSKKKDPGGNRGHVVHLRNRKKDDQRDITFL